MEKNRRISAQTIKCGLMMEWTAKLCIILPFCLAGKTFGDAAMCFLLGGAVWSVAVTLISAGMWQDRFVNRITGIHGAAGFYGVAVLLFCAAQAAVFVRLGAELAAQYLLPRTEASKRAVERLLQQNPSAGFAARYISYQASPAGADAQQMVSRRLAAGAGAQALPSQALIVALCLMVFAAAAYFAVRRYRQDAIAGAACTDSGIPDGTQAGRKMQERLYLAVGAAVAGGMLLLAVLCAQGAASWTAGRTSVGNIDGILRGSFEVFACLGGVSLPVLYRYMEKEQEEGLMPENQKIIKGRERVRRHALCAVRRAGGFSLVLSGFVCAAAIAYYRAGGAGRNLFPAVSMTGELQPAVFFRQYSETVFALLLFVCTAAAAASALYHMLRLTAYLYPVASDLLAELRTEINGAGVLAYEVPGVLSPELPGTLPSEVPGRSLPELPEVPPTELPGTSSPELPGTSPELPEVPPTELPGASLPELPGTSPSEIPGVSSPELPGTLPPELPGTSSPELPAALSVQPARTVCRVQWAALSAVCLASAGFSSGLSAISYYRAWNMQLLVPLLLILYGWYYAAQRRQRADVRLKRQPVRS